MAYGMRHESEKNIFYTWYNEKKYYYLLGLYFFVALSIAVSYLPSLALLDEMPSVSFVLGWLCIAIALDYLFISFQYIDLKTRPEALFQIVRHEMSQAFKKKDMSKVIGCYEMFFVLIEESVRMADPLSIQKVDRSAVQAIEATLEQMPSLTLFQAKEGEEEPLIDRITFLESVTAKRMGLIIRNSFALYVKNGDVLYIGASLSMVGRLFFLFHDRYETVGFVLVQSTYNIIVDGMKNIDAARFPENPITQFSMVLVECVKIEIDRGVFRSSIPRLISLLESLMQELFRMNRNINPAFLMQPFAEIGEYIAQARFQNLPDRESIISQLKQILAQFAILETLSERLDIHGSKADTEATYMQDLPFQKK